MQEWMVDLALLRVSLGHSPNLAIKKHSSRIVSELLEALEGYLTGGGRGVSSCSNFLTSYARMRKNECTFKKGMTYTIDQISILIEQMNK